MVRAGATPGSLIAVLAGTRRGIPRHHHQCIDLLAQGRIAVAHSDDGVIEAVTLSDHLAWFLGVQWHPEDSAATDPVQAALFAAFIDAARLGHLTTTE